MQRMVYHQGFALYLPSPVILSGAKNLLNSGDHWSPLQNPPKVNFIAKRFHPSKTDFIPLLAPTLQKTIRSIS